MLCWLNKTNIGEFFNLLLDLDLQLEPEMSRHLLDRLSPLFNIELVGD